MAALKHSLASRVNRALVANRYDRPMDRGQRIREAANSWIAAGTDRTTKELCAKIGITEQAFYRWVDGNTKSIKAENFVRFSWLTRYHPRYLLWGESPKLLADDPRFATLLDKMSDLRSDELEKLIDYADILIRARKP